MGTPRLPTLVVLSEIEYGEQTFSPDSKGSRVKTAGLLFALAVAVFSTLLTADAQPPGKIPRIGVLAAGIPTTYIARYEAFRQGLREVGYVEGQTIAIEYRYGEGKFERLPELAAELVRLNVDLIVASAAPE